MYCNVTYLCCTVLYCIVLYCIVLYCIVLYCIVLYCIVLYCIVLYCIVLYCIAALNLDRTDADPIMSPKRPFVIKVQIDATSAMKREANKLSWCNANILRLLQIFLQKDAYALIRVKCRCTFEEMNIKKLLNW